MAEPEADLAEFRGRNGDRAFAKTQAIPEPYFEFQMAIDRIPK
jgi:hypothetical protein